MQALERGKCRAPGVPPPIRFESPNRQCILCSGNCGVRQAFWGERSRPPSSGALCRRTDPTERCPWTAPVDRGLSSEKLAPKQKHARCTGAFVAGGACHCEEGPGDEAIPKAVKEAQWMLWYVGGDCFVAKSAPRNDRIRAVAPRNKCTPLYRNVSPLFQNRGIMRSCGH